MPRGSSWAAAGHRGGAHGSQPSLGNTACRPAGACCGPHPAAAVGCTPARSTAGSCCSTQTAPHPRLLGPLLTSRTPHCLPLTPALSYSLAGLLLLCSWTPPLLTCVVTHHLMRAHHEQQAHALLDGLVGDGGGGQRAGHLAPLKSVVRLGHSLRRDTHVCGLKGGPGGVGARGRA